MASFSDLRPGFRSAKAGRKAVRRFRSPILLAVSAALLLTAFFAVSELATLRGAKAHDASAYLTRELGSPLSSATLVRTPARIHPALGGKLEIRGGGLKATSGRDTLSLRFGGSSPWRQYANGVSRPTSFGREAITFGLNRVEHSLLVNRRQGTKVWRWQLGSNLRARVTRDGSVQFGSSALSILPVAIFDQAGKDITPSGLRWSVRRGSLELRLDDARLPTPYVIDPIALVAACPGGGCATQNTSNGTSITLTRPGSVTTGSLMVAQVTIRNNSAITAPAGWTTIGNLRTSGTGLEQRLYYRIATITDTAVTTYQWSWTGAVDATAAILAYSGTDATNPFDVTPTDNAGTGTTATATALTTTQANDMVIAFYGVQGQSGPAVTASQDAGQGLTEEFNITSGSAPTSKARAVGADGIQAAAAATGSKTATISTSTPWVAHLVALMPPLASDGAGTLTSSLSNVSASQTGRTVTFTYTAATGGMQNGSITLVVPSGWSAPSTTGANAGYTTASTGTVSVASQTITVSGVTLSDGATMTITYGSTAGGGPGATATSSAGAQTWQAQQKARSAGTLTNLGSSPSITVYAADGSGTMSSGTSVVSASQTGRTITFTYTAAAGGISNGSVTLAVPAGWSAPSTTGANAGYTTASAGTLSVSGQTITVSSLTLAGSGTLTITYGAMSGGGPGATVTSSTGAQTWTTQEQSTSNGSLANVASQPSITVYAADGSGTMSPGTSAVSSGQTGRTITFTYTAPAGGISNGSVTLAVPSGWSAPSTTGSAAGYTTASSGTLSVAGSTITVSSLTLAAASTLTITYGSTASGGPGATATSSTGAQTWTTQEKSTSAGTLTDIASQPSITIYAADGSGTLSSGTSNVSASQTGRTITFTYTAPAGGISSGSVTLALPAGWSAPSTTGSAAGYSTASSGTLSVSGQTITVSSLTLAAASTFTITYGSTASGGPGATATSTTGSQTWTTQEKSTSGGSLTNIASSPSITVYAADGSGTMSSGTSAVSASQTGRTITFTYTAAAGGISNGTVTVAVPSGWSAPSTTGSAAGYSTASSGTLSVSGQTITVSSLTLAGASTFTITYGSTASGGPGATATSSTGSQNWTTQEKSTSGGSLTDIASQPSITVYAADGSGTMSSATSNVSASQTGKTITFTYTAAAGGISNGSVTLVVPSGWSAPSTTGSNAGYTTSSSGTVSVSGQTITVSSLTLAGAATATITYGSTASGGPAATVTASTGAQTWTTQEKSTSAGTLADIASQPSITVNAADGSGTMSSGTSAVSASQTGRTITFTYTAAAGGISNGSVTVVVPSGWTAPSTTGSNAGYTTASSGTVSVSGQTITVSSLTLAAGNTATITYGSTASGGPGATATSTTGAQTWTTQEKSSSGGSLTSIASSPSLTVYAADGSGTISSGTSVVSANQTGRTITFTYTAAAGGISNGSVTVVVPSGWTAPSTTGSNAGYTTASSGTVSVSGQTITVSSLTLAAASTLTITYGSTASGGPGATATSSTGSQAWTTQEKSTSNGSLTDIASQPSITVYAADGSGTMSTGTSLVSASQTGRTVTFTYTAAAGGISNGTVALDIPSGWSAPSTTGSAAGYSTASSGTLSVSGQAVTVSSLTLAGGSTFTITYGSTASGGPGATATSSTGAQNWTTQEKSTSAGSLTSLATSPSITVYAGDGSGTLTSGTSTVAIGSTGNTIDFTYTAAAGGISNGTVTVAVPSGWSAPSTTGANAGYTTATTGTVSASAQTITVSSVTLAGGSTMTITYGSKASGGPGATATSSAGAQTWQAQEKSTSGGTLANLGASPSITVLSADGSGTLTTGTGSVNSASTGNSITFTYTAATGGLSNGAVTVAVPSGWSAPSTTASNAGYTTSSTGSVSVSSQTITVSGVTLAGGSTFTITYGSTAGGGPGATAPVAAAAQAWQAQEKSSSGGTLTNLASSPAITVNDPTAPSDPSLTLGSFTNASVTGSTVYIRQGSAGGFTVTGTSSDTESGIDHLTFPNGLGAGWSGGGQDNSSPYTGVYTFSAAATAPAGNQNVTATNGWALTSGATAFTVVADTTAPAVTAPSVTAGYYTSLSVPVAKNGGSDGGSGVSAGTSILERDEVALSNGSCGSFPGTWSSVTLVGGNDTSVVSGKCYRYRELLSDNVGNQGTSGVSSAAKVDTSAPSTPALTFSGLSANASWDGSSTLYVRPSAGGAFTVTAASSDAQSDIGSYTFGTLNSNGGVNWGGSQTGDHFDYTFDGTTAAPSTTRTVSATNGAGTSSANATYSIAEDTTAPSVTAPGVTAGYYTSLSVPVTKNGGSDGGSGVNAGTSVLERDDATLSNGTCGGFSGSWTTVTLSGGNDTSVASGHCYEYRERLSDRVGNQGTSGASNIAKVDNQGPANSISLTSLSPAGAALKNGTTVYYHGSVSGGGSFKLTNALTDGDSGPASSATAALGGTTSGWSHSASTVSTPSGGPYESNAFSWTQGTTSSPTEVVTGADGAGNTTAAASLTFTNDSTAPTGGALTVNGGSTYSTSGSFAIDVRTDYSETQSATESGLASSTLTRAAGSLTNDSCGSYGSPTTIVGSPAQSLPTGCYLYTLTGTDNVGNAVSISTTVKVDTSDPTAPSFTFSNFAGTTSAVGDVVFFLPTSSGSFDVAANSSDGDSGIAGYTFPNAASFGSGWSVSGTGSSRTYSYTPGSATPGTQTVSNANHAGRTNSADFSVVVSDATPPTTSIQCNGAACLGGYYTSSPVSVTLSADDGPTGSGVDMIRYTIDGSDPTPVNGSDYIAPIDIVATTTVKFRAYDNLGNEEAVASQLIQVDATAPSGQTITLTGADAPHYGSTSVSFALGNGSDAGSGLDLSSAAVTRETGDLSGDSCSSFTSDAGTFGSPDTSVSGAHCYRYTFTIADNVGNVSAPVTTTAKVDTDNPSVALTDPGTPLAGIVSLGATASDSSTAIQQVVFERAPAGGSTWTTIGTDSSAPYSASWNTGAVADGLYDLRAVSTDTVGHTSNDVVANRRVDNTAPDTIVDSSPSDPSNDATPTFTFSSSEPGSTFECRVDGGGWASCSSPHTTAALGAGSHTFDVRATDPAGNTDATPASSTWTIDLTAPNTTIDSSPSNPSGNATPSFSFSSSESGSSFECRVDGGGWSACTSPDTISPALTGGSHTFDVRATDGAGNTDGTPASHTWTVDLTAPNTTIDSSPSSPSNDTTPTFSFSSSEPGSSFECRVDGGGWSSCTSPHTTTALAEGTHTFDVRATDASGNTDASPASFTWTIDLTAPNTTLDSGSADPSNDTTPTFAFSAGEPGSTFECRVDGGGWSACTSPHTTTSLGAGSHTFDVRATDPAGNTDATPASQAWTIDLTAPNTTIDSGPPALDNDATPTFTFSSSEPGSTFECRVDGGSWTACSSPHTTAALGEGSHTFEVRAVDAAGNADASPASHTWSIDLGPPSVTITAPATYINGSDPSTYSVTASSPDGDVTRVDFYECSNASVDCATGSWTQFDTDNTAPYAGSWSTPGMDGKRALRAVAVDASLNAGEDVHTVTIDRTAPSGVTISYPNGYVAGSFAITTNSGPDSDVDASSAALQRQTGDLATDTCSSYGGWSAATSPDSVASAKCAQYRFRVADNAGNWSTSSSSNEVKSDTDAPTSAQNDPGANLRQTVALTTSAGDTGGSGLASVAFQRRPAGGGSWTTIDTDNSSPYSTSLDTTSVTDGLYDFRTVATDVAGNSETSPGVVSNRRIDNTAPAATMLSPGNPIRGTVALTSNTSDGGSGISTVGYELAPNGGGFNTQPSSWDTTLGADGLYDLRVTATDVAGNSTTSAIVTTRVDNTAPALTFSSPSSGDTVSGTVSLTASSSDASPATPAVSFAYKLHSDPPSAYAATGSSWNTTTLPGGDGLYDLRARATDDASNTTTVENTSIRVDNVAPSVAITAPAAAINGSLPSPTSFSATAADPAGSGVDQVQFFECTDQSTNCSTGIWSPLGSVAAPGPYIVSWSIPATDGNHALAAVATDNAGHPSTDIRNVDVDRTAPETTIVGKPADPSNAVSPSFTFSSSEAGSTFECRIDGGAFAPCTSPHSLSGLTDNDHTFDVRATDAAGNTDPSPDTWTWHRDTNDPTATLNNPGANVRQVITLTSGESDPPANGYASGLASVAFEYSSDGTTWAPIGTNSSSPFNDMLWNTAGVADGVYQLRIVVQDVAGNSTASTPVTNVRIDNTVPTTSQDDPGPYLRASKTLTGSAADSGSGIDHVDFERAPTGGGPWTTIATDSTPGDGFQASFDTTGVSDGHYDFRTVAFDVAGNQAAATPVTDRLVDNTVPNTTLNDPGAYLRGAVSLSSSTSDPGGSNASGVVGVAYEYSPNGGTTWLPTGSTFDSTSVADGNVDLRVVATDAAGNTTASAAVTKLVDNTKPSTSDNAPGGWHANPVTVTLTPSDAGSGVNVTEYSVDGNPTYTVGTSVVIPAPADGSNDGAHTIAYFSVDNAGNIETVKSTTVLIDSTPPVCPSCSAADYLRGPVTLSASPAPDGSGIQSVAFEYTDAGGSTWTTIGTDTTGPAPYTAAWDTTAVPDGHYDLRILITDNADNVTTADLPDKVVDNTNPDVALVGAPTEGQIVGGSVGISASASDATSPIASVEFFVRGSSLATDTTAPFSLSWNTTSGSDGAATIQIVVTDMAGNSTTSAVRNVIVDNVSPTPTLADPGQNLSGTVSLTASSDADTTQVDFERRPAGGGSWVTIASDSTLPWGTSLDTTTLADGLYDFRAVATDGTGHTGTSPIRANVRVDNTLPSGSVTAPTGGATVGGTNVTLSVSVSDAGSGVASVSYELRPTGGGSFSPIASSSSAPFSATWDATTVSTGSYDLRPVITDRAGNTFTGSAVTFNVDVTAPTVTLTNPGTTIFGTVTLNATVTGSGATNVAFAATPAGGASWTSLGSDTTSPWSLPYDTTKLADGIYDLRATVTDNLGNSSQDVVSGVRVDNTAPRVVSSSPAEGSTVGSATAIGLVLSEAATPVGVTLDGGATVTPVINGTHIDYNTGALATGPHTLSGELQDPSGKKAPFRVHFTVYSSGSAPPVEKNTSSSAPTTVGSADGFAAVTMPAGAWSTSGNDWIVLRIAPQAAPSGLTNGFGPGPEALDVTAHWALSGAQVHEFAQPVEILIRSSERGLVPATFDGTAWRIIHRVPTAGTLPSGWVDGFFRDANGIHVLTKHLSLFALLRDLEAPQAPQNVRGYLGPDGLTIRWLPGSDNSGTYDYVTLFADSSDAGHYDPDYTAATVAGWKPGDSRIFRLKETDLAGNESELTQPLVQLPSLVGMTPDEAEAALAKLGLTIGSLTVGGSGRSGTVTGPEGLVLAGQGSAIDLTVAPGGASTSLVFKVVTAPKFKPAARKKIAARITLTRSARVTAQLFSPRRAKLYTWRFTVRAGRTIVKLRIPKQVRRPGIYTIRWSARAGRETVSRTIRIRVVGAKPPVQRIQIVLAGVAAKDVNGKLGKQKPMVVNAVEPTFDAAANRNRDVRVLVVDADEFGVGVVRDLHAVFPSVKIVALAAGPRTMAAALKAGATIVLPRSTPPATLAKIIQRLAKRPVAKKR